MEAFVTEIRAKRDNLFEERLEIYHLHAINAFKELKFLNPEIGTRDYHLYLVPACDPSNHFYDARECGEYVRDYFIEIGFYAKLKQDALFVFISWNSVLVERQKKRYIKDYLVTTQRATGTDLDNEEEDDEGEEEVDEDEDEEEVEGEEHDDDQNEFEITANTDRIELMKFLYAKR